MAMPFTPSAVQCTLLTLGKFELRVGNHVAPAPPTQKARVLVAFLAANRGNDVARERLLELLWPHAEPERAREGLRTALSSIRHVLRTARNLPEDVLFADKSVVRWRAIVQFDAARFEELASSSGTADKRAALKLYGGDFLEGAYDEWAISERERLASLYERVLAELVVGANDVDAARLLLARDPYHEPSYMILIGADLQAHRQTAAAELAAQYRSAMREIRAEPSAEFQHRFGHLHAPPPVPDARRIETSQAPAASGDTNLPAQLTTFIGREDDIAELKGLVRRSRLVTVAGTGGIGKTRLAIQAAADLRGDFKDGVWFVDLATVSDPDYIAPAIASALGIPISSIERPVIETLVLALQKRRLLLLVDNCEHLISAVAAIVLDLLRGCPQVHICATSREAIKVESEQLLRLSALCEADAMTLFAERARAANKRFELSDRVAPAVSAICRRLDGIPLAIELAAPRVNVLSPKHLLQHLDEHFRILTTSDTTAFPRHKTVRALTDWSYDLLTEQEQTLLRVAGVFVGGFTLEAAAALCEDVPAVDVLDLLSSLVAKSLVQVDTDPENERYTLLQTTQRYARDKLAESREADSTYERHAEYFLALMQRSDREYGAASAREWLQRYRPEIDNVRAAIDYFLRQGNTQRAAGLTAAARELWLELGLYAEGFHRAQRALETLDQQASPALRAGLWLVVAQLANVLFLTPQALDASRRTVDAFEKLGDEQHLPYALQSEGYSLIRAGLHEDAESKLLQAQALAERLGNRRVLLRALLRRAHNASETGKYESAIPLYERCLQLAHALEDDLYVGYVTAHLSTVYFKLRDVPRAVSSGLTALEVFQRRNDSAKESHALANLAEYHLALNKIEPAKQYAHAAIQKALEAESMVSASFAVEMLASIAALEGDTQTAARLLGYVKAALTRLHFIGEVCDAVTRERAREALRKKASDAEIERLLHEGAALSDDEAFALATGIALR
ncbi:MAG TPA: NB-ARC domain-containing protein [Candidatus Baltobacteraceae bacterium]|nr:NB-ARC domain-containing protein [Candidatus Baltobacteraceae bacterium]